MQTRKPSAFGELLRRYRVAAVLTQEELAARAGVSTRAISDLERGVKGRPHAYTVRLLAEALGLEGPARIVFEAARMQQASVPSTVLAPSSGGGERGPRVVPLVGRIDELALLERHLASHGAPVLVLSGEPGIGKSRLLQEAAQQAVGHGWRVLTGGCQRRHGHAPFAPLLEALEAYLARCAPAAQRGDLRGCAWLVRLLPELASGPIEPLPAWTLPPEQERRLMDKAVGRFLANIAGPAGTLLLLDDLQWAQADALDLLATLVRAGTDPPLRVIGSYRDTEVAADAPLAGLLADLAHAELAHVRALTPLRVEDARQLLSVLLADWPEGATLRDQVVQRAGGVPFYLVSYAQGLQGNGADSGAMAVPWNVAQGLRQRMAALLRPARDVLGAAAVIGRVVPVHLLTTVADHNGWEVLTALDVASRAGLLVEEDQSYRFAHDLIREVVEADVGAARRLTLHRQIAEALEQEAGEPAVEALAYHYGRAGLPEKAAVYLELAGDRAWAQHANAAAEGYYREAMAPPERWGQLQQAARVREKLARVLHMAAQDDVTLAVLEQAAEAYRAADDLESLARITAQIGLVYVNAGHSELALERLQPLAERMEARGPSPGLVKLYAVLVDLLTWFCGRFRDGQATAERAVALARPLGDAQLLAETLAAQGLAHLAAGHLAEAKRALEEAIPLAEMAGDFVESLPKALWLLSIVHLRYGELDHARRYCARELVITEQCAQVSRTAAATALRGLLTYVGGEWAQARQDGEQVLTGDHHGSRYWASPIGLTVLGLVCYGQGQWAEAAQYLEKNLVVSTRRGHLEAIHFAPSILAECDLRAGDPERARARLAPLIGRLEHAEGDASLLLPPFAWAHLELGDVAAATVIVGQAITQARARNDRLALVDALRVQALVAIRQGQGDKAQEALEEGLALARSMPYPYAEGRLLHLSGEVHLQQQAPAQARERLEAARAIFRRLGAQKDIGQVEQTLTALHAVAG